MKTPREILFTRHSQAGPKLDSLRRNALAALPKSRAAEVSEVRATEAWGPLVLFRKIWLELIWPARRAWAGMAAVWLAVLVANLGLKTGSPSGSGVRSVSTPALARAFLEQQRALAELLPPATPPRVAAPEPSARPRSERPSPFKAS